MKALLGTLLIVICSILMAAHLAKAGILILTGFCLLIPFLLFWKNKIVFITIQALMIVYGLEWFRTLFHYVRIRIEHGEDWMRLALILGGVALLNFSVLLLFPADILDRHKQKSSMEQAR